MNGENEANAVMRAIPTVKLPPPVQLPALPRRLRSLLELLLKFLHVLLTTIGAQAILPQTRLLIQLISGRRDNRYLSSLLD